jgi:DNA-binding IclR family transcriptional regulator
MNDVPERARKVRQEPKNHRTIDRVTEILEHVAYNPGITFSELSRKMDAAKSSVHGFVSGLLAKGWLYQHDDGLYTGPTVYGLILANDHHRVGFVSFEDLRALHKETGATVFLGTQAGNDLIYIAEVGHDPVLGFEGQAEVRRDLLKTAGGKALLAAQPAEDCSRFLRRRSAEAGETADDVQKFVTEVSEIRRTGFAFNFRPNANRYAIATVVRSSGPGALAAVTLVGPNEEMRPRQEELCAALSKHVKRWTAKAGKANALI